MNDKLYLLGGYHKDLKPSPQVFVASLDNLSTHQLNWQSAPDTPWHLSAPVALYSKFLMAVGGRQPSGYTSQTREMHAFNPSSNYNQWWKYLANIPAARHFPAAVSMGDKIIVIGIRTLNILKV